MYFFFFLRHFLASCFCSEHTVGNTVRKLLHLIREEYSNATKESHVPSANVFTISKFVLQGQPRTQVTVQKTESNLVLKEDDADDPDSFARMLKPVVMEAIQDILDEIDTVYDTISKSAKDHIHSEYVFSVIHYSPFSSICPCGHYYLSQRNHLNHRKIKYSGNIPQVCRPLS